MSFNCCVIIHKLFIATVQKPWNLLSRIKYTNEQQLSGKVGSK